VGGRLLSRFVGAIKDNKKVVIARRAIQRVRATHFLQFENWVTRIAREKLAPG
jgi:hypothetical protein